MSELSVRLLAIGGVIVVIFLAVAYLRRRDRADSVRVGKVELDRGIYLFTSATCATCDSARRQLELRFGRGGFVEYSWEEHPQTFTAHSIDRVPCTLVVDQGGHGVLWRGQPDRMIYAVDP